MFTLGCCLVTYALGLWCGPKLMARYLRWKERKPPIPPRQVLSTLHSNDGYLNCSRCGHKHKDADWEGKYAENREVMLYHVSHGYLPWNEVPDNWKSILLPQLEHLSAAEIDKLASLVVDDVIEPEWLPETIQYRVRVSVKKKLNDKALSDLEAGFTMATDIPDMQKEQEDTKREDLRERVGA